MIWYYIKNLKRRCDGIGRRARLKIWCPRGHAGSTPATGIFNPRIYSRGPGPEDYEKGLPGFFFFVKKLLYLFQMLFLKRKTETRI